MKTLLSILAFLLALASPAATIKKFSDYAQTNALSDSFIFPVEIPGQSPPYDFVLFSDLKSAIGGTPSSPQPKVVTYTINVTSNAYFYGDTYLSNAFITNLTVFETVIVSNFVAVNVTNTFQITTNLYATYTYVYRTYVTNLYATYVTNEYAYITNLYANKITVQNLFYESTFPLLSTWVGPTNTLNVSNQWDYVTYTPCAITQFVGGVAGRAADTSLAVSNAADTNITVTITATDYWSGDFTNSYTLTNSERRTIGFRRQGTGLVEGLARWFQKMQ